MKVLLTLAIASATLTSGCVAQADRSYNMPSKGDVLPLNNLTINLGEVTFPGGKKMQASWGLGSGAYARADEPNTIYALTDRGVNIKCRDAQKLTGAKICPDDASGASKIFPFADFNPAIIELTINADKNSVTVQNIIELTDSDGRGITGLSNPIMKDAKERGFDIHGKEITYNPNGMDTEALVKLKDGSFWVAEEYAASIAHVSAKGEVLKRLIPKGWKSSFSDANYPVQAILPEILNKRKSNRGIESIAINPAETHLYFIMQSPLANPTVADYKKSRNVRLFKMEIANPNNIEQYLYVLDSPQTFEKDNANKKRKSSDVKVSEMLAIDNDELLILERISKTTKLYRVHLSSGDTVPEKFNNLTTRPTLEQTQHLSIGLAKSLIFNSDHQQEKFAKKIEGIAPLGNHKFFLINDNDFGIGSEKTVGKIVKIDVNNPIINNQ